MTLLSGKGDHFAPLPSGTELIVSPDSFLQVPAVLVVRAEKADLQIPAANGVNNPIIVELGFEPGGLKNTLHSGDSPCPFPDTSRRAIVCSVNDVAWLIGRVERVTPVAVAA